MKPTLVVMAAGMGSRYGGLKQIDPIGPHGEAMLDYSIYDAIRADFGKIVFVIRHDIEAAFRQAIGHKFATHITVEYAFQELTNLPIGFTVPPDRQKPWGTGHAILMTADLVHEPFAVINADDYYGTSSYQIIRDHFQNLPPKAWSTSTDYALVGFTLRNTLSDFGTVARGLCQADSNNLIQTVTEITNIEKVGQQAKYTDAQGQPRTLSGDEMVSMNMWGFTPAIFPQLQQLFIEFLQTQVQQPKAEFYIPAAVTTLINRQQARAQILPSRDAWFGMTYQQDKPQVIQNIRTLIAQGVYPEKLFAK